MWSQNRPAGLAVLAPLGLVQEYKFKEVLSHWGTCFLRPGHFLHPTPSLRREALSRDALSRDRKNFTGHLG